MSPSLRLWGRELPCGKADAARTVETIASISEAGRAPKNDPALFVSTMLNQGFPRSAQVQGIIKRHIPIPASLQGQVTEQQFYNNLEQYSAQLRAQPFDLDALTAAMVEMRAARQIFDRRIHDFFAQLASEMSAAGRQKLADRPSSRRGTGTSQ